MMHDTCLLEFFERLTSFNQAANSSDETEVRRQVREFNEIIAPYGYKMVRFEDQACFVPVQIPMPTYS